MSISLSEVFERMEAEQRDERLHDAVSEQLDRLDDLERRVERIERLLSHKGGDE